MEDTKLVEAPVVPAHAAQVLRPQLGNEHVKVAKPKAARSKAPKAPAQTPAPKVTPKKASKPKKVAGPKRKKK